ncbi:MULTISPECIES: phosphoglucosamine mutase [Caulobacter]|jgi:phosphoglucosamine mutase|uniref:Phosphoglucosamine mutase n=1 Tax=Caulobacter vibrioides OR37 TaxID=1292034 RepID=R0EA93_CAUVI|nr:MULTISPECIES: phosphoglucosamine mutase [Caulobacter]ENZ79034.1 phosphoglucosamine mutase [Caulobacter vibrioides OR37]MBQ1563471.1 phosphoglucosamine mutase [Caulobacter sp.]
MSKRAYFGTDGIRGQANKHPMTAEVALRVGLAAGKLFRSQDERRHLVVIGKDTRLSGYMIEPALVAGFTSLGMDVRLFGPLPTPAVAMMTRSMRADLGVMISASHNSFADNGIKFFGPDGYKLSDAQELKIEALMDEGLQEGLAAPRELGRVKRIDDAQARYVEIVKATFPRHLSLSGLRIVIDCANGAAYKVAPTALYELGAEVISIGVDPDGTNINEECGSTHPEAMAKMVREYRADIGIALDGDADRLVVCDEKGVVVDGDQIMAIIAGAFAKAGALKGGGVVATVMSNLGLERYLNGLGLNLERTSVGDRYVMQRMREGGFNLGGEQSGHLILSDFSTTGDGLIAALQVLAVLVESGKPMSALGRQFEPVPQLLENVRFAGGKPLEAKAVKEAIADGEAQLNGAGRIVVRASGTEPLIRIMAEGDDPALVSKVVKSIVSAVKAA